MFRLFFGSSRTNTCRPVKNHTPGSRREMMSDMTLKTLGSGDLIGNCYFSLRFSPLTISVAAVKLPAGEERNEWMAANSKFILFSSCIA
jgi:hypothetical protein